MTQDTDLIRRGDAIKVVTDADRDCRGAHGARENIAALYAHPMQEPPSPAPVVPAEGPISTLEMVYRNMPDIPELPEAYQPRNIARNLAAFRSARLWAERVTGWQPIETAPRDGTVIVAISGVAGHNGYSIIFWDEDGWAGYTAEDEKRLVRFPPALWCDIPEPPAALLPAGEGEE